MNVPAAAVAPSGTVAVDSDPRRWRMLALLSISELLGMSLWFAGSAVAPQLRERWSLSGAEVGWLTAAVQLGFVAGTALSAFFNLADLIPARRFFAAAALLGAVANSWLAAAHGYPDAFASRFLAGACLAGVYPPAMKMAATWFRSRRGLAVGTVVGALTVGKAAPYLATALPGVSVALIALSASGAAVAAALLVTLSYHDGPYAFESRPFSFALVGEVVRGRRWRLATGGYLGHMAELYSYWTWIPAFLAASVAGDMHALTAPATSATAVLSFGVIAVGGAGCVWGGLVADRVGRIPLVMRALVVSGTCCALVGLAFGRTIWLLAPVALIWGFFIIADSAQFSVLVTESVPAHAVGTALTLQISLGFLLTTGAIQVIPPLVRTAGWPWAFALLAAGPVLGIISIRRLSVSAPRRQPQVNP